MYQILILMLKGALLTLAISFSAISIGLFFGFFVGIFNSKYLHVRFLTGFCKFYVSLIRGTPLFIQILIIYFGLPSLIGYDLSPFFAGVIALGINSSAYLSETVRGGINAIPKGQWEAALLLGYSKKRNFSSIILPQAVFTVFPSLANEFICLIKESSILMVLGVPELTKVSKDIVTRELMPMQIYTLSAVFYLGMTSFFSFIFSLVEKRLSYEY